MTRKLPARPDWGVRQSDDEARAYLQSRLGTFSGLMFTAFVTLIVFLMAMYRVYPDKAPPANDTIFGGAAILLAAMAVIWRALLVRTPLSLATLNAIDLIYAGFIGAAFAAAAVMSLPLRSAAYASLVYGVCTVFTRALVVPSTERRTLATSVLLFAPMFAAAIYLAAATEQELPGPAYAAAAILLGGVAIVLATQGSRIIYGLRREVSQAKKQLGQYTLVRRIAKGGMGEVHEAHHALLRRRTAIKLVQPQLVGADALDRFEREVQITSRLTHPNTVAVFDYGRSFDGEFYYAMEYLDGIDLAKLVAQHGAQPIDRVVAILLQVAGALEEAHAEGLVHRDVKPANIILCERGRVPDVAKVVDFGIAKEIRDATDVRLVGTPGYMAPETILAPNTVGLPVDLFALGAVGYFLLAGKPLYTGTTDELITQTAQATPRPLAELRAVPAALDAIVMRLLSAEPSARYTAAALVEALAALPPHGDWDRTTARTWWRDRAKAIAATPSADARTATLVVKLDER